ncbi:MAG: glycogen debranching protein GlgX [Chloroflexi bacterium]|nr:glycogen debranching protein GlgX [Chloroflexota bacterium]
MSRILPGKAEPLGATWDGEGVNFAVYSESAKRVDLCLFDPADSGRQVECVSLPEAEGFVWHAYLPEVRPGQLYGYRAHGPYVVEKGLRFNPAKLLIDPYAKAISGSVDWNAPVFGYQLGDPQADLTQNSEDDAQGMPKCVVVNPAFPWEDCPAPRVPLHDTVIYETHVKDFSMLNQQVAPQKRGTYSGLASPPMLKYLKDLGITAVELMPVHDYLDDKFLADRGLRNHWGYNTTNFFSPTAKYSSNGDRGEQVLEFKSMVRALHKVGIEVILDVVFNHTSEGNHLGPTLSFRGLDNSTYYKLSPENKRYYMDYTGTGNTLNVRHPQVLKLIMDSLRYWVVEMHVDGFRFDLASTLARSLFDVDMLSPFFDIIYQDPILSGVKLIAEPWDIGTGGYQVGKFPVLWAEWNGDYRDTVRHYWRSDDGQIARLAYRLSGSSDLYQATGRGPFASINFITAHDGFTLNDLVSYKHKHNEANGENNKDGIDDNISYNYGVEGPTDDPNIVRAREQQKRNFLATLLLSQGVPMLLGGDEIGRTKKGNNNSYCQDNEINWYDWHLDEEAESLLEFTRRIIQLRRARPVLRRRKYFQGRPIRGKDIKDIIWLRCDGQEMSDEDWKSSWLRCMGIFLSGDMTDDVDLEGEPIRDDSLLLILNSHDDSVDFAIPDFLRDGMWELVLDSNVPDIATGQGIPVSDERYRVSGRSLVLLRRPKVQAISEAFKTMTCEKSALE